MSSISEKKDLEYRKSAFKAKIAASNIKGNLFWETLCFRAIREITMNVLVTGADGFIGSHLVEKLVCLGYKVRAFVLYNSFNSWGWLDQIPSEIKNRIEVFSGDIRDPNGVREAMVGCDAVLHLAAFGILDAEHL